MEPSHKDCASDDGEPENPRMGEKEACYESLKKAAGTTSYLLSVRVLSRLT
jgi:hypothetical protein